MPRKPPSEPGIGFTSPWSKPVTGTPLDYVPIDAPVGAATSTRFKAPAFRRALIAGVSAAAAVGIIYVFPAAVVAAVVMAAAVWGGGKLADRLNDHDRS